MKNAVRIIGGKFRGRKLAVLDSPGLRPTPDRIRETVFNWLMHDIHGATCLDAFAGTGALGFEAMSRGAESVIFVEKDPKVAGQIQNNLAMIQGRHPDGAKRPSGPIIHRHSELPQVSQIAVNPSLGARSRTSCSRSFGKPCESSSVANHVRHSDDGHLQERHPDDAQDPSGSIQVIKNDIFSFLKTNTQKFDIIFLDPPFNKGILKKVLPLCLAALSKNGVIYIEHESSLNPKTFLPENINIMKQKTAGDVGCLLIKNSEV